jgi:hypothetical protein
VRILIAAVYSFIGEKLAPDVTALLAILALLLTGVLTPAEAFAGFSHPAMISVAAVLAPSAASSARERSPFWRDGCWHLSDIPNCRSPWSLCS